VLVRSFFCFFAAMTLIAFTPGQGWESGWPISPEAAVGCSCALSPEAASGSRLGVVMKGRPDGVERHVYSR